MPQGKIVTALDIGTWTVSAMIAEQDGDGRLTVLGTGQRESRGVKRGYIADQVATEQAIRETLEQAESIAGISVDDVWASFSAGDMSSDYTRCEIDVGGYQVEQEHIDRMMTDAAHSIDPKGRMVLHAMPGMYELDGLTGVFNPLGLHADRLSVNTHIVATDGSPVRNVRLCASSAQLRVKSIVASPIASGMACLTDEERQMGVALVEIGAGVTNVALFTCGMLVGLTSLQTGAGDITDDIASAFGTTRAYAERLKCYHGSATTLPRDNLDMIDLAPIDEADGEEPPRITKAQLIGVIQQRLAQMTSEISAALKHHGFTGSGRHIVLTGGGAELKNIADYLHSALGRTIRIGRPRGVSAMPEAHSGPAFASLAGLVLFAAANPADVRALAAREQRVHRMAEVGLLRRLIHAIKANY